MFVNPLKRLRTWWQHRTGEEETPFDGDAPYWLVSMVFHLVLMFVLAFVPLTYEPDPGAVSMISPPEVPEEITEPDTFEEVYFSEHSQDDIGANSVEGTDAALSLAQEISEISDVPSPMEFEITEDAKIEVNETIAVATGLHFNENLAVKGAAGEGATGATGAVDRITHEILLSLEERKTLVVWLFDQSLSLSQQRQEIHDRFDRIYEELGVIEAAENPAFAKHDDKPLLTQVVAFGDKVVPLIEEEEGSDNLAEIKQVVRDMKVDETGNERVFTAVSMAANQYKHLRVANRTTGEPERNVMIIAITDERGDDFDRLDTSVQVCRKYQIPVYVVGVPAPFGQEETEVKIDPELGYDKPWGRVSQGPESLMPERVKIGFSAASERRTPIDSGFGPFALTRLAYETGGIFFSVHPNRNVNREVRRGEIGNFSSHLSHFFDPEVMRRYKPDYVSANDYIKRLQANKARKSLVEAARLTWVGELEDPQTEFQRRDEAQFVNDLTEAQKAAAKLLPKSFALYSVLQQGETDRDKELAPRWRAGYDLAMGQVMAVMVRTQAYNAMLAQLKSGKNFTDPKNNTWRLVGDNDMELDSRTEKMQKKALEYLARVVEEHPGTPWALIAQQELEKPIGWRLEETYVAPPPPRKPGMGGNNNNAAATDDKARMLKRGEARKPLPKL